MIKNIMEETSLKRKLKTKLRREIFLANLNEIKNIKNYVKCNKRKHILQTAKCYIKSKQSKNNKMQLKIKFLHLCIKLNVINISNSIQISKYSICNINKMTKTNK